MTTGFRISYDIVDDESAETGDVAERGWEDEEGVSMDPDDYDAADGVTAVAKAVAYLRAQVCGDGIQASSSGRLSLCDWWSVTGAPDIRTGAVETRSFHPYGFSEDELANINAALQED